MLRRERPALITTPAAGVSVTVSFAASTLALSSTRTRLTTRTAERTVRFAAFSVIACTGFATSTSTSILPSKRSFARSGERRIE